MNLYRTLIGMAVAGGAWWAWRNGWFEGRGSSSVAGDTGEISRRGETIFRNTPAASDATDLGSL